VVEVYIGVGTNLGDRFGNIKQAVDMLNKTEGIEVKEMSPLYETEPVGSVIKQGRFLNGALKIRTTLSPRMLLGRLKEIERKLGRTEGPRNGPRPIDLDILFYGDINISEDDLVIPHPRIRERDFVKRPLRDLGYNI
jgi:2-amino-4-hydroxy-6-hydroxymethyldihydropteridine diphosphokinase